MCCQSKAGMIQWLVALNSFLSREYKLGRIGTSEASREKVEITAFGNLVVGKKSSIKIDLYRVGDICKSFSHLDRTHF